MIKRAVVIAAALLGAAGVARSATIDGTLITNCARQTYSALDGAVFTPTYCQSAYVWVVTPHLMLSKYASPVMQCSGGTVTFCIWARNDSVTSAFNVVISDPIPGYQTDLSGIDFIVGSRYAWQGTDGPPAGPTTGFFDPTAAAGAGITYFGADGAAMTKAPYHLRWFISVIGPSRSALVCWAGTVL